MLIHLKGLNQLLQASEEYIIPLVTRTVFNEVTLLSKSLELDQWKNEYVVRLLELADRLDCQNAIDSCSRHLASKISDYGAPYKWLGTLEKEKKYYEQENMRNLTKKANLSLETRNKLKGLVLKAKIKKMEGISHGSSTITNALRDLTLLANDLTAIQKDD